MDGELQESPGRAFTPIWQRRIQLFRRVRECYPCGMRSSQAADEARDLLRKISQGERSVTAYAAEFGPLADALPNRHVDDLADDFTRGLTLPLQTALALSKMPKGTHWHLVRDTALDLERPGNRGKTPRSALFPEPDMMDLNAVASFGNRPPPPHRSAPARPGSSSGSRLDQMSAQELKDILKRYRGCFKCGLMFADHTKSNCTGQQHPALLHLEVGRISLFIIHMDLVAQMLKRRSEANPDEQKQMDSLDNSSTPYSSQPTSTLQSSLPLGRKGRLHGRPYPRNSNCYACATFRAL